MEVDIIMLAPNKNCVVFITLIHKIHYIRIREYALVLINKNSHKNQLQEERILCLQR